VQGVFAFIDGHSFQHILVIAIVVVSQLPLNYDSRGEVTESSPEGEYHKMASKTGVRVQRSVRVVVCSVIFAAV
jgi:hypothetical protein